MRSRLSGERGVSVVEAPIVLLVIAFFALGVLGFVQIFIQYQHLTSATRSAARYAAKADYDPSATPPVWGTRPDSDHVKSYAAKAAPEFDANHSNWTVQVCNPDDKGDQTCPSPENQTASPAQHVHVRGEAHITDGPYTLISGLVDGLSGFFGGGDAIPRTITIHSEAVAAYE